jgi:hypothetical protein
MNRWRAVTRKTIPKELSTLRAFLRWCVERGAVDEAPVIAAPPRKGDGHAFGPATIQGGRDQRGPNVCHHRRASRSVENDRPASLADSPPLRGRRGRVAHGRGLRRRARANEHDRQVPEAVPTCRRARCEAIWGPIWAPRPSDVRPEGAKPSELLGDRRGLNPRHLEPQRNQDAKITEDSRSGQRQLRPENATQCQDSGPWGPNDLRAAVVEFLKAVSAGDDRSEDLAKVVAERVLDELGGRLALQVLEGGPLAIPRALQLASAVVERRLSSEHQDAAESQPSMGRRS